MKNLKYYISVGTLVLLAWGAYYYYYQFRPQYCPDSLSVNMMLGGPGYTSGRTFYIKDGKRIELSKSKTKIVQAICFVKKEVSY